MLSAEGGRHENFIEYLFLSSMRDEVSNHPDTMLCKHVPSVLLSIRYGSIVNVGENRSPCERIRWRTSFTRHLKRMRARAACRVPRAACRVRRGRAVRQAARAVHAWKVLRADCRVGGPFAPP